MIIREEVSFFLSLVLSGLCLGALYAFVATGYSLIFGVLRFINFAHGEIFAVGAYAAYVVWRLGFSPPVLILAGITVSAAISCVVERFAYRPLSQGRTVLLLATSVGISVIIRSSLAILFGDSFVTIRPRGETCYATLFHLRFACGQIYVLVVGATLTIVLWWLVQKTQIGRRIRAVASNRSAAESLGISKHAIHRNTFLLGGAYAGAAGALAALITELTPQMGVFLGLKAFTAAIIGGVGSVFGAFAAGLLLGVFESLATGYFGSQYQNTYVLLALVMFLLLRSRVGR